MALRPGGAKSKGANGEREAATLLTSWAAEAGVTIDPTRNLEQVRSGGFDLNGVQGLAIEVKRVENMSLNSWWKQAVRQADDVGWTPFLMWRQNRKKWKFRVRVYAAIYPIGNGNGSVCPVAADLDTDEGKRWFQYYCHVNKDILDETDT